MCGKNGAAHQHQNLIPTVKHGGGTINNGCDLLPQGLDSLLLSMKKWLQKFLTTFCPKNLRSNSWNSKEDICWNRTIIRNTEAKKKPLNGYVRRKLVLELPCQTFDRNTIEKLWLDLNIAIDTKYAGSFCLLSLTVLCLFNYNAPLKYENISFQVCVIRWSSLMKLKFYSCDWYEYQAITLFSPETQETTKHRCQIEGPGARSGLT